jgi:hypothetical protein
MLEAIKIRREGFAVQPTYPEFVYNNVDFNFMLAVTINIYLTYVITLCENS